MARPLILITGASQGIGAALARVFAREVPGCRLALVARSAPNLKRMAAACLRLGAAETAIFPCDVTDASAVAKLGREVRSQLGSPDVLINNAGLFRAASFLRTTVEEFDTLCAANLRSVFLVSKQFVPGMVKRKRGHVFNMSSIAGLDAYPQSTAYCAAKFGVVGLSRVMREELKASGVRVTVVCPGATVSPSWAASGVPDKRLMPAEDVAQAFLGAYRLSDRTVVEEIVLRPQLGDI
jgi:short-subunit dehydrogenase